MSLAGLSVVDETGTDLVSARGVGLRVSFQRLQYSEDVESLLRVLERNEELIAVESRR